MKKILYHFSICLCLVVLFGHKAVAQTITFYPPYFAPNLQLGAEDLKIGNASIFQGGTVDVPPTGTVSLQYSVSLYRTASSSEEGTVAIYSGDNNGLVLTGAITPSLVKTNPNAWAPDITNSAYVKQTVFGMVTLSNTVVYGNPKLYAQYWPGLKVWSKS